MGDTIHDTWRSKLGLAGAAAWLAAGVATREARAHGGISHADGDWWNYWNWDPVILPCLVTVSCLYARGLVRLWRRAGAGQRVSRRQAGAFAAGMFTLFVALISPMDPMSDELSSVHMVQHMLLMMVAAPLVVWGASGYVLLWAVPERCGAMVGRLLRRIEAWHSPRYLLWQPVAMWLLYAATLWIWHVPALYQAALRDQLVHDLQHLAFFAAACLFWRVLLDPISRLRLDRGLGALYLFLTSLHASVLGVFMALSPGVWYADYIGRTEEWGLTPLEDQQLAGLIMWMPACAIYAVVAAVVFGVWLNEFESEPHPDRRRQAMRTGPAAFVPADKGD